MRMQIDVLLDYALQQPGTALLVIEAAGATGQEIVQSTIDLGNPNAPPVSPPKRGSANA